MSTNIVKIDPQALKAAGIDMSVTKNDLIDMVLLQLEEDLKQRFEDKKKEIEEFKGPGAEVPERCGERVPMIVTQMRHELTYEDFNHSYNPYNPKSLSIILNWVKDKHPEVLKLLGKKIKIGSVGNTIIEFMPQSVSSSGSSDRAYFKWYALLKDIKPLTVFKEECAALDMEYSKIQTELHNLRNNAPRKLRVDLMRAMLAGSESGKDILGVMDAMAPNARYKKGLPKPRK